MTTREAMPTKKIPKRCLRCGCEVKALPLCAACIKRRDADARVTK